MRSKVIAAILIISCFPIGIFAEVQAVSSPTSEVAGFLLKGNKPWEILKIDDLDTAIKPSGQRLLPLLRLLNALQIKVEKTDEAISFTSVNNAKILLDLIRKEFESNGERKTVDFLAGRSDITLAEDVYLPPGVLAEILSMKIEWDEQNYQFVAQTDQKLSIWKLSPGRSLFSIQTTEIKSNLPEMLGPGSPPDFSLDFVEFQFHPYFNLVAGTSDTSKSIAIEPPRETFWGNAFGGRYKVQFMQSAVSWNTVSGFQKPTSSLFMVNSASWTHAFPNAQIEAGDSTFGLNDLTFPILRLTGVRFNGLKGFAADKQQWSVSPGMSKTFSTPEVIKGSAPAGSKVELIVNDRTIEKQDVSVGTYEFNEITLTPGTLNVIRVIITEPSGFQRVIERNIFGRSTNLPKGVFSYLGGMGTNRQVDHWNPQGFLAAGRALYGVTSALTVGTTWADQHEFYLPIYSQSLLPGERGYPNSSLHWGGQLSWIPFQHLILGGDMSFSAGEGIQKTAYNGMAYKLKGEIHPSRKVQVLSEFFRYSRNFFNGENRRLADREGYSINGRWIVNRKWTVTSTTAAVWNNVDGNSNSSLYVDFQDLEVLTRAVPWSTITLAAQRIAPNWEGADAKMSYTLNIQASPSKKVYFEGSVSKGDYLDSSQQPDFFSGLRIPGFTTYRPPDVSATLRVSVMPSTGLGAGYFETAERQRGSFFYNFRPQGKPVQLSTELGYDLTNQAPLFIGRADLALDRLGKKRIVIDARYEQGQVTAFLTFSISELFSHSRGLTIPISNPSISPDRAGVQGRVFIDANANGRMDPGEPGLEGVRVVEDGIIKVTTDRNGYFLFGAMGLSKQSRIWIDMSTVPAIYSPTHAIQTALLGPGGLTEINLAVTPLHSVSGVVQILTEKGLEPERGVRVKLISTMDGKMVADSITARDGSYYLGDVRPGKYYLEMDKDTLPSKYTFESQKKEVDVAPKTEPQELKMAPFEGRIAPQG